MAEQAVLGGKRRDRRFGILIKHAVVPDAQAKRDVQLRLFLIEHKRLQDGVADVRPDFETALRDAELGLVHRAAFARDARDLIPLRAQDARERVCLMDQPRAGGDADLLHAEKLREVHRFLDAAFRAVAVTLVDRRGNGKGVFLAL